MVQLTDSTRRLIIFITIVLGGSILLIFDIPVLYLMMVVIGLAIGLMIATGMLIISELIKDLRNRLKNRKPKVKKPKPRKEKTSGGKGSGEGSFISGLLKMIPKMPSLPKGNLSSPKSKEKPGKKEKPVKNSKKEDDSENFSESLNSDEASNQSSSNSDDLGPDLLDGLDLDDSLDIDAELESVNPEFDTIRTPYGDTDVMQELPTEDQVRKMDITTSAEEDDVVIDNDEPSDEIDEIYSSTIEIGSDSGGDLISTMEGGDSISGSDLASYSSSDEAPYMYGGEGDGGEEKGEEQFELSQGKGMGDDDLIASLKADISDMKKRDDDVLLRDLKDVHVTAEELAEELQDIMQIITKKAKKK
jgi:hypothetical protein